MSFSTSNFWVPLLGMPAFSGKTHSSFQARLPHLLLCEVSGLPKTTLQFIDSLEGLTELSTAVILMVPCYSERMHIKINKSERLVGQNPGDTRFQLLVVPSPGSHPPSNLCDNTPGVSPTREAHPSPGVQGFIGGVSHIDVELLGLQSLQRPH